MLEAKERVEYLELPARSLLNGCSSPRVPFRWTINPYRGCEIGCKYCYARYTHEFMELRDSLDFETKIFAKRFDADAFKAELGRVRRGDAIAIGTATDPYQPAERRFGITRKILEVFARERNLRLWLTTKSDFVAREIDLFRRIARGNIIHVSLTITTLDPGIARLIEPRAPRPDLRVAAVRKLAAAGLSVGVLSNPILPGLTDREESLDALASAAAGAGASYFGGGLVFLRPCAREVFLPLLREEFPRLYRRYRERFAGSAFLEGEYAEAVKERVRRVRERHGLASSPPDYRPELWEDDRQGRLFLGPCLPCTG